jgi:hypothetical protein
MTFSFANGRFSGKVRLRATLACACMLSGTWESFRTQAVDGPERLEIGRWTGPRVISRR